MGFDRFTINRFFTFSAIIGVFALANARSSLAYTCTFYHWGKPDNNSKMLETSGFPNAGSHDQDINSSGSVDLNYENIKWLRDNYTRPNAIKGPAFYVSKDFLSSRKYGYDLIVVEIDSPSPDCSITSTVPEEKSAEEDAKRDKSVFDRYPLAAGPYENEPRSPQKDFYAIYRPPNPWEYSQGVRVKMRPPEASDAVRIWDQMGGDSDEGKIHLLEKLSDQIIGARTDPTKMLSRSTQILFERMNFDIGYGFLDHFLQTYPSKSRWYPEIFKSLATYGLTLPDDPRSKKLFDHWMSLNGGFSDYTLKLCRENPTLLPSVLHLADPRALEKILNEVIDTALAVPKGSPEYYLLPEVISQITPSILASPKKTELLGKLSPMTDRLLIDTQPEFRARNKLLIDALSEGNDPSHYVDLIRAFTQKGVFDSREFASWVDGLASAKKESEPEAFTEIAKMFLGPEAYSGGKDNNFVKMLCYITTKPEADRKQFISGLREGAKPFIADYLKRPGTLQRFVSSVGIEANARKLPTDLDHYVPALKDLVTEYPEISEPLTKSFQTTIAESPASYEQRSPQFVELVHSLSTAEEMRCMGGALTGQASQAAPSAP